jgi:hypothetical protein
MWLWEVFQIFPLWYWQGGGTFCRDELLLNLALIHSRKKAQWLHVFTWLCAMDQTTYEIQGQDVHTVINLSVFKKFHSYFITYWRNPSTIIWNYALVNECQTPRETMWGGGTKPPSKLTFKLPEPRTGKETGCKTIRSRFHEPCAIILHYRQDTVMLLWKWNWC